MCNTDLRNEMRIANVRQWEVAEALGLSETHFSRKLRKELHPEEKEKVMSIIDKLDREKREAI